MKSTLDNLFILPALVKTPIIRETRSIDLTMFEKDWTEFDQPVWLRKNLLNPMRKHNIIRPTKLTLHLPEDIRAKLDLYLWSELEQRVPKGAYQDFFVERIIEFFSPKEVRDAKRASDSSES